MCPFRMFMGQKKLFLCTCEIGIYFTRTLASVLNILLRLMCNAILGKRSSINQQQYIYIRNGEIRCRSNKLLLLLEMAIIGFLKKDVRHTAQHTQTQRKKRRKKMGTITAGARCLSNKSMNCIFFPFIFYTYIFFVPTSFVSLFAVAQDLSKIERQREIH